MGLDDATRMWQGPNQAAVDKIYFDAVVVETQSQAGTVVAIPNPSGFAVRNYGVSYFYAYLGYWRDCNLDGFIGDATAGADHYAVDPSVSISVCPIGSLYNDGTFVQELLAQGNRANQAFQGAAALTLCDNDVICQRGHVNFVRDDFTRIWHDWGLPGGHTPTTLLLPFPHGTMTDANGHFNYVDGLTFGRLSGCTDGFVDNACWIWPSERVREDRNGDGRFEAGQGQCVGDANNDFLTDDIPGNAQQGIASGTDNDPTTNCSPIPNAPNPLSSTVRDRWNNSIGGGGCRPGTAIIEPYEWGPRCDRNAANDQCTQKADLGLSTANPNGAVYPTFDHVWRARINPTATPSVPQCSNRPAHQAPGIPQFGSNFEANDGGSAVGAKKVAANTGLSTTGQPWGFALDTYFNPSESGLMLDQELCVGAAHRPQGCGGVHTSTAQWIHSHGVTAGNPQVFDTYLATFYADVQFASPFPLQADRYSAPVGLNTAPLTSLPAGGDNVHVYGAEECSDGSSLLWECNVAAWLAVRNLKPTNPEHAETIFRLPKVGDFYDLRDVECFDNDATGPLTTDADGPLDPLDGLNDGTIAGTQFIYGLNCDTLPTVIPPG